MGNLVEVHKIVRCSLLFSCHLCLSDPFCFVSGKITPKYSVGCLCKKLFVWSNNPTWCMMICDLCIVCWTLNALTHFLLRRTALKCTSLNHTRGEVWEGPRWWLNLQLLANYLHFPANCKFSTNWTGALDINTTWVAPEQNHWSYLLGKLPTANRNKMKTRDTR